MAHFVVSMETKGRRWGRVLEAYIVKIIYIQMIFGKGKNLARGFPPDHFIHSLGNQLHGVSVPRLLRTCVR